MNLDGSNPSVSSDPTPRERELPYEPFQFPTKSISWLSLPNEPADRSCLEVLHRRRSRREFGRLPRAKLSALLWYSAKTLATFKESSGFLWEHRPAPSAGGRHPIYIAVFEPRNEPVPVFLYDAHRHALLELDVPHERTMRFISAIAAVVPTQSGSILWFIADRLRTLTRYSDGDSLIWRDAGSLLATISNAAEGLDLNCCAYGVTGDSWVSDILPTPRFSGTGGCIVGSRVEH
jgi:hypothetical protein